MTFQHSRHYMCVTDICYRSLRRPVGHTKKLWTGEGGKLLLSSEEIPVRVGQLPVQLLQFGVPTPHHHLPTNTTGSVLHLFPQVSYIYVFIIITIFIIIIFINSFIHLFQLQFIITAIIDLFAPWHHILCKSLSDQKYSISFVSLFVFDNSRSLIKMVWDVYVICTQKEIFSGCTTGKTCCKQLCISDIQVLYGET